MSRENPPIFPFRPPTPELVEEFSDVFALTEPLPLRPVKALFDRLGALVAVVLASPVMLAVVVAQWLDGLAHPEHAGPLMSSYVSRTCRGDFMKRKFRVTKVAVIDRAKAARGEWGAHGNEWDPTQVTCVGRVLKDHYLDELPQLFSILAGHMSFVGPRPLAVAHYEKLVEQGNKPRQVIQGGLFSEMSVSKGTDKFHDPTNDLRYVRRYMTWPWWRLLALDVRIILTGLRMIKAGEGH